MNGRVIRHAVEECTAPAAAIPFCSRPTFTVEDDPEITEYRCREAEGPARSAAPRGDRRWWRGVIIPLVVLGTLLVLFVGGEVLERLFFPDMSVAMRHLVLTVQAALVTAAACGGVYWVMQRQQGALTATAEQLTRVLASYQSAADDERGSEPAARFENPHLVHCREVLTCDRADCPMYAAPGERCWQVMAVERAARGHTSPAVELQRCLGCEVYQRSCPDKLTELGESFNNLMFLLEQESSKVGRMRAQLLEKEKMVAIGQIAAGIAHEIGNPLSSISSIVQMIKRGGETSPRTDQLDLIEAHIQRISTIVRQLVTLARPVAERWELSDVGATLEEAVRLISFDRRARDIVIDFERPESLPRTYALHGQLQQVFINLLLNALDVMSDGGRLTVRVRARRADIVVRISDTGNGIDPRIGRRVFEPFFTTKEPGHGTGLGLAVSYGIVQEHGGHIEFASTPGEGTTFTVRVPIVDRAPKAP